MNTMEITKIVGALCGALLIYLLVNWAGESMYHVQAAAHGGDGHGEGATDAYVIEVAAAGQAEVEEEGPPFAEVLATADAGKGEKVFSKCKACHKLDDGANGTGPHLFNIVDRAMTSIDGFAYSGAFTELSGNWTPEELSAFLANPKKYAPGTKMTFAGLKKIDDRANLIAYLQTIK